MKKICALCEEREALAQKDRQLYNGRWTRQGSNQHTVPECNSLELKMQSKQYIVHHSWVVPRIFSLIRLPRSALPVKYTSMLALPVP